MGRLCEGRSVVEQGLEKLGQGYVTGKREWEQRWRREVGRENRGQIMEALMPDQAMGLNSAGFRALAACLPPHGAGLEYSGRVLLDFQHIHKEGLIPKGLWER